MGINFIYFDVGGVVVKDFSKSDKWQIFKQEIGIVESRDIEFDIYYEGIEKEINCGRTLESFIPEINERFGTKILIETDLTQMIVERFEPNLEIWPIMAEVKNRVRVGLLTNMYPGMLDKIRSRKLLPEVNWDGVVNSSLVGACKPDREIFEEAEKMIGMRGKEILFIDNTQKNVDEAAKMGWRGYHYDPTDYDLANEKLEQYLKDILR